MLKEKNYIDKNSISRANATTEYDSVFSKTMEKRVNIGFIADDDRLKKCFAKLNFGTAKFVNNDLTLLRMKKDDVLLSKPIYCNMAILEVIKVGMYNVHYNFLMKRFKPCNCDLFFTDTEGNW